VTQVTDSRFPIGPFEPAPLPLSERDRQSRIDTIAAHPRRVRALVSGREAAALDRPYRAGGWTVRQLVHHLADSHLNSYIRYRLALTEDRPEIRPYGQDAWAELPDAREAPVEASLHILDGVHARWSMLMRATDADAFPRTLVHPEIGEITLDFLLDLYSWHCRHHEAHLERALGTPVASGAAEG